jgi:hypothetical protein
VSQEAATTAPWLLAIALLASVGCPAAPRVPGEAVNLAPAGSSIWFVDISEDAGVDVEQIGGAVTANYILDSIGTGGAWLDYDGDGDADLYLAQGATESRPQGPPDTLLRNDGDPDGDGIPTFTDVTREAGLGDTAWSFGVATADYDNDGDPDIYLANWGPNRLYRNDGDGTFTEIGLRAGVDDPHWGVSAAWSDIDRDGDLDLYVANYVEFEFDRYPARGQPGRRGEPPCRWRNIEILCGPRNLEPGPDVFYRNEGDADGDGIPTFVDATADVGLRTGEEYFGLAVLFFDADNDGDDELYVANDSLANAYFVNRGDGTFEEAAVISGLAYNEQGHDQAGMGIATADYDDDGRFDLAVTNFSHDHDTIYRNDGMHTFTDVSYPAGLASASYFTLGWGIAFSDLDLDGHEDLFVAHGHTYPQVDDQESGTTFLQPNSVFRNLGNGKVREITERVGPGLELVKNSRSVLPLDLDGDGDPDFLITNLNAPPDLLRNDGVKQHWFQVRLVGSKSNRDGIGALVSISAGGRRQARQITRTASFAGSTLPVALFGLGESMTIDRLEVRWPSGARSVREDLAVDRQVTVREAEGG